MKEIKEMNIDDYVRMMEERIDRLETHIDKARPDRNTIISIVALIFSIASGLVATTITNLNKIATLEIRMQYLTESLIELKENQKIRDDKERYLDNRQSD